MTAIISILLFCLIIAIAYISDSSHQGRYYKKAISAIEGKQETQIKKSVAKSMYSPLANIGISVIKLLKIRVSKTKKIKTENKLKKAGLLSTITVDEFLGLQVVLYIVSFFILTVFLPDAESINSKVIMVIGAIYFAKWPDIWVKDKTNARKLSIQKELPFILSSIAVITDAGLGFMQAIAEVCNVKQGEMVEEFKTMLAEINMGVSRKQAFERMADRVEVHEVTLFTSAIVQSLDKGAAGIVLILNSQSAELWSHRKEKARELAEKASVKLFLPLLVLVLPAMLIFLLSPAAFSLMTMFK